MKKIFTLAITLSIAAILHAQAPDIEWQKCIGETLNEVPLSMKPVQDGGYILAGQIETPGVDCLVIKTDGLGNTEWRRAYGSSGFDRFNCIEPTSDGGYIAAGYTNSVDGDITNNHGNYDMWIVKLDNTGNIQWQKCLGGSVYDAAYSIYPAPGGYIVTGVALSSDGDVNKPNDGSNYWVVKLNETGTIQWQKFINGVAYCVKTTTDEAYIIAGEGTENGTSSFYILKLDSEGDTIWEKNLGGSSNEFAQYISTTPDGGYIAAGGTMSNDGDVTVNHGGWDGWIVKLNGLGDIEWQKSLGGSEEDTMPFITFTPGGGYITTTGTISTDGDITFNHGAADCWIVKLSAAGNIQWQKSIGGSQDDNGYFIYPTEDGGYMAGARTESNDGDVSGNHGLTDAWLVKLFPDTVGINEVNLTPALVYPNPVNDVLNFQQQYKNVAVYGTDGKMVMQANDKENLNVSSLQAGVYFLKIETGNNKMQNVKFVKN